MPAGLKGYAAWSSATSMTAPGWPPPWASGRSGCRALPALLAHLAMQGGGGAGGGQLGARGAPGVAATMHRMWIRRFT